MTFLKPKRCERSALENKPKQTPFDDFSTGLQTLTEAIKCLLPSIMTLSLLQFNETKDDVSFLSGKRWSTSI
jgi:hypothetical protein